MCSPRSGAPTRGSLGPCPSPDPESLTGVPSERTSPAVVCSTSTTIRRASVCGCSSISPTDATGPAGTPASSSTVSQCSVVCSRKCLPRISTRSVRFAIRSVLVTKRSSLLSFFRSRASVRRVHVPSFEAPTLIQPFLV